MKVGNCLIYLLNGWMGLGQSGPRLTGPLFPFHKRFIYKAFHHQPTRPDPVRSAFLYRSMFPFGVDGDLRFGDRFTHLCPDPLDQEESWKERVMMNDACTYKTQRLYPFCPFLVWTLAVNPALKVSSASTVHPHCGSSALFWARARLPGQHFHPNAPYPSFPAGLTRTQHSDECGQHGADPHDRDGRSAEVHRILWGAQLIWFASWPHHGKVTHRGYCCLPWGWVRKMVSWKLFRFSLLFSACTMDGAEAHLRPNLFFENDQIL
jgi:hypothetical protein